MKEIWLEIKASGEVPIVERTVHGIVQRLQQKRRARRSLIAV
jgi:hypothetical protein